VTLVARGWSRLRRIAQLVHLLALRRMSQHVSRSVLTAFGVSVGVAAMVAVTLINRAVLNAADEAFGEIGGAADLEIDGGPGGMREDVLALVSGTPGLVNASPLVQESALIRSDQGRTDRLMVLGTDLIGEHAHDAPGVSPRDLERIQRDPLSFLNSTNNLLLGRGIAARYGYRIGDKIQLHTPGGWQEFEIWGLLEDERIGRAFAGAVAVMYFPSLQVAFDRGRVLDRIQLDVVDGADADAVARRIADKLGPGFRVERPQLKGKGMSNMLAGLQAGLTVASLIAALIGVFLIYNAMLISVVQRRRELGILKALGALRRDVLRLLLLEALGIAGVGALIGAGFGILLARAAIGTVAGTVSQVYTTLAPPVVQLEPLAIATCMGIGLLAALVGAFLPARNAANATPLACLQTSAATATANLTRRVRPSDLIALALLGIAEPIAHLPSYHGLPLGAYTACASLMIGTALLIGRLLRWVHPVWHHLVGQRLGPAANLASRNLIRNLSRTSITVGGLAVSFGMATSSSVFVHTFIANALDWVEQSIPADLFVTSSAPFSIGGNVPMAAQLGREIAQMPGMEAVEAVRTQDVQLGDKTIKVSATDTAVLWKHAKIRVTDGNPDELKRALLAGDVAVSENLAARFRVKRGDTIQLRGQGKLHAFKVAGVIVDYSTDLGIVVLDNSAFLRAWGGEDRVSLFKLHAAKGADVSRLRSAILQRFGEKNDLVVVTNREFRRGVIGMLAQLFGTMRALQLVAILIAALGIANELNANVHDRVRELGVLRAVGMRRRQLRAMITAEAVLIAACGLLAGLVLGAPLAHMNLGHVITAISGWHFEPHASWIDLSLMAAGLLVAAAIAGWFPARRAAALTIVDALENSTSR
jgi:putative ABC transport system permease protein